MPRVNKSSSATNASVKQENRPIVAGEFTPRCMRLLALSSGLIDSNSHAEDDEIFKCLAQDCTSKVRLLIQTAAFLARRQNRICITVADIDFALKTVFKQNQPSLGHRFASQQPPRYLRIKGTDLYEQERFTVLLSGVAKQPLILNDRFDHDRVVAEWLPLSDKSNHQAAMKGESSKEDEDVKLSSISATVKKRRVVIADEEEDEILKMDTPTLYLHRLVKCILANDAALLRLATSDLATSNRLNHVIETFVGHVAPTMLAVSNDARIVGAILRCLDAALIANPFTSIASSKTSLKSVIDCCHSVMTCSKFASSSYSYSSFTSTSSWDQDDCDDDETVLMAKHSAARLMASILVKYSPIMPLDEIRAIINDRLIGFVDQCLAIQSYSRCYSPLICLGHLASASDLARQLVSSNSVVFTKISKILEESLDNENNVIKQRITGALQLIAFSLHDCGFSIAPFSEMFGHISLLMNSRLTLSIKNFVEDVPGYNKRMEKYPPIVQQHEALSRGSSNASTINSLSSSNSSTKPAKPRIVIKIGAEAKISLKTKLKIPSATNSQKQTGQRLAIPVSLLRGKTKFAISKHTPPSPLSLRHFVFYVI